MDEERAGWAAGLLLLGRTCEPPEGRDVRLEPPCERGAVPDSRDVVREPVLDWASACIPDKETRVSAAVNRHNNFLMIVLVWAPLHSAAIQ